MRFFSFLVLAAVLLACNSEQKKTEVTSIPSPIYIDSNYHGSCDPEIVFNPADSLWYIYYTARRSLIQNTFLGTPLGVIVSKDLANWEFLGYCKFDGVGGSKDADETFWAPAIIYHEDTLHMFVTYKSDTLPTKGAWGGRGDIVHYKTPANEPVNSWTKVGALHDSTLSTIDATVYRTNEGFHVWYKGKKKGAKKNELYSLFSTDLYNWEDRGFSKSDVFNEEATGSDFEEAPFIFTWNNAYWLITDPHIGLFIYKSDDAENWKFQGTILLEGGSRNLDNSMARHPSVAVINNRAFIFYHVEPWRIYDEKGSPIYKQPFENRRAVLQVAELEIIDGKLHCDRNKKIEL